MHRFVSRSIGGLMLALPLVACESAPVARKSMPPAVPQPDLVAREKARQVKLGGLDTPKARAEYVRILADACEARHDPQACLDAAAVDRKLGRTLLFHGCSLGEDAACTAYVDAEVNEDKRARTLARFDATLALEQGCAYSAGNACNTLARWNGMAVQPGTSSSISNFPTSSSALPPSPSLDRIRAPGPLRLEDLSIAQQACILGCNEEQKGCVSRCNKTPGSPRDCVFGCSDTSLSCARGCREATMDACQAHPFRRDDCDGLKGQ